MSEEREKRPKWSSIKRDWGHRVEVRLAEEKQKKANPTNTELLKHPSQYYQKGAKIFE